MPARIGINGFGRIGRLVLRASLEQGDVEVVHVNDPELDVRAAAYLFTHDSVHGRYVGNADVDDKVGALLLDGRRVRFTRERDPARIPWAESASQAPLCVLECSGAFTSGEAAAAHLSAGARKVIISAPAKDESTPVVVLGVNERKYTPDMHVISNASCTTNCLAPIAKARPRQRRGRRHVW